MAAPNVAARNTSFVNSNSTAHNVTQASHGSGDLLIAVFCNDDDNTVTPDGSWVKFGDVAFTNVLRLSAYYLEAGGSSETLQVTTNGPERSAHSTYAIQGHADPSVQPPEISTGAQSTGTTPDPDQISPAGGTNDFLFIACCGHDDGQYTVDSAPTSYTNLNTTRANNNNGCGIGTAERQRTIDVENPSTFSISTSSEWIAFTIVIHPASSVATNVVDGKVIVKDSTTNLVDGKAVVKDSTTNLVDGLLKITDNAVNLFDGLVLVKDSNIVLLDGKIILTDIASNPFDGILKVTNRATNLLDGLLQVELASANQYDGLLQVKDSAANLFDGIIIVEQADIALFDGRLIVKDAALDLFNGLLIIKDSSTVLLDGKLIITSGTTIVKFDGKLRVLSAIPNRPHDVFINKKVSDFIV